MRYLFIAFLDLVLSKHPQKHNKGHLEGYQINGKKMRSDFFQHFNFILIFFLFNFFFLYKVILIIKLFLNKLNQLKVEKN